MMKRISYGERIAANIPLLDEELRAVPSYIGLSLTREDTMFFFQDNAGEDELNQAWTIVRDHDATGKTQEQERYDRVKQFRQELIEELKQEDFAAENEAIKKLVKYVRWLEAELRLLRGL